MFRNRRVKQIVLPLTLKSSGIRESKIYKVDICHVQGYGKTCQEWSLDRYLAFPWNVAHSIGNISIARAQCQTWFWCTEPHRQHCVQMKIPVSVKCQRNCSCLMLRVSALTGRNIWLYLASRVGNAWGNKSDLSWLCNTYFEIMWHHQFSGYWFLFQPI